MRFYIWYVFFQDLKSFLDDATEGVIYFSLGTTINPEHLGNKTFQIIAQTFSELPYKVLWKGDPDLSSIPSTNIKLAKWFPQQDILSKRQMVTYMSLRVCCYNCFYNANCRASERKTFYNSRRSSIYGGSNFQWRSMCWTSCNRRPVSQCHKNGR